MNLDVNNLLFCSEAACLIGEAKCEQSNHKNAIAQARTALTLAERALHQTGADARLAHRPFVVLAQSSRKLGAFDAALGNLTRASQLAAARDADDIAQLVATVRREKDMWEHDGLQRQGFAGFRASFNNMKRSAADATAAPPGNGRGAAGGDWQHPAFAAAGASSGNWAYSDWSKAKWEEEFRAAYERMSQDSPHFGSRRSSHKFPWEHDPQTRESSAPHPDPFAPPGGRRAGGTGFSSFRPGAGSSGVGTPGGAKRGLYSVLQVEPSATGAEIKKAYMKLVNPHTHTQPSVALAASCFVPLFFFS